MKLLQSPISQAKGPIYRQLHIRLRKERSLLCTITGQLPPPAHPSMLRPLYRTDETPSTSCLTASDIPASNQPKRDSFPRSNLDKIKRSLRKIRHRALTQCPGEHAFFYLQ
uniref:Uncharacterized protein n=1 Tax=Ombrophytum subterraneum TaxID=50155 RepID=A0A6M8Q0L2_9MAGN|nr:hypothetical protein [Ombrophytum subterraneum]